MAIGEGVVGQTLPVVLQILVQIKQVLAKPVQSLVIAGCDGLQASFGRIVDRALRLIA